MNQLYVQRFQSKNPDQEAFDKCWEIANEAFSKTGNWGNVASGIKTHLALVTVWGGYGLIEVEDPSAFNEYQMFHVQKYSAYFEITFDPVGDLAVLMPEVYGKK